MAKAFKGSIIDKCQELIKSFNPVTHSIDTHVDEVLGDTKSKNAHPDNVFIQQVVYGWYRERRVLESFIANLYADNAARVLRADNIMYTIFAYLAIFCLDELGFDKFKEIIATQDPTKMYIFVSYLFNMDNLWTILRADWMKIVDLKFVEDEIIAGIEAKMPAISDFLVDLEAKAQGIAASLQAKKDAANQGPVLEKKPLTRPISPNLTQRKPPLIPEPTQITQKVIANEVPSNLDRTNLERLEKQRQERLATIREETAKQYSDPSNPMYAKPFKFSETKAGKKIEDLRAEIEAQQSAQFAFDRSFVTEVPDFSKNTAKVRTNVAGILREDALFRKQQAKDAALLKKYEEELRDPSEFYAWQQEMRDRDEQVKLEQVVMRRELAKQSAEDAALAIRMQKEDNKAIADIQRQAALAVKQHKVVEDEIRVLQNQNVVQAVTEVRKVKPREAMDKVAVAKVEQGKRVREELEKARIAKEEEERQAELERADKIRQLKAVNTVHKEYIKVFDPTEIGGPGFLDEMSYMEMKERHDVQKKREEAELETKRIEIQEEKEKKARDLEARAISLMNIRQLKAESNRKAAAERREKEAKKAQDKEMLRSIAAAKLEQELREKREEKEKTAAELKAAEERVRRQQQYLGVAKGRVDEVRIEQLLYGQEREIKVQQELKQREAKLAFESAEKDRKNKEIITKIEATKKKRVLAVREKEISVERREAVAKIKQNVLRKKEMVKVGRAQHETTQAVKVDHNPYAARISEESVKLAQSIRSIRDANRSDRDMY